MLAVLAAWAIAVANIAVLHPLGVTGREPQDNRKEKEEDKEDVPRYSVLLQLLPMLASFHNTAAKEGGEDSIQKREHHSFDYYLEVMDSFIYISIYIRVCLL